MGARKNFLEIYRQFGHAPSKRFTSPGLEEWYMRNDTKNSPVKCTYLILLHVLILSLTSLTFCSVTAQSLFQITRPCEITNSC
jgi:antibiotic biosynthesis monooxygenase (ABM) superfamily enzyme